MKKIVLIIVLMLASPAFAERICFDVNASTTSPNRPFDSFAYRHSYKDRIFDETQRRVIDNPMTKRVFMRKIVAKFVYDSIFQAEVDRDGKVNRQAINDSINRDITVE